MVLPRFPVVWFLGTASGLITSLPYDQAAANATSTSIDISSPTRAAALSASSVLPNTYIVQLKADAQGGLTARSDPHTRFHKRAQSVASISYETRHEYTDSSLFLGLSLTLSSDNDLHKLKDLEDVKKVWPVRLVPRPLGVARPRSSRGKGTVEKRDANVTLQHITGDIRPDSALQMSNVDDLHSLGIKGKGVKIAIIDTGVDYHHPSLGGCFGPGCKISFGYALAGDDYDGNSTPVSSPDPLTTCADGGHGTHVTGIIGMEDADGTGFGLLGVAPEATLGMYRVFGCDGAAADDLIMAAMTMAATDGADVISMSLGSLVQSEEDDPYSVLSASLNAKGIAVIVAAGNDGSLGAYSASSPAIGTTVLAVGSVDNKNFPVTYELSDSRGRHFRYSSTFPIVAPPSGLSFIVLGAVCLTNSYRVAAAKLASPDTTVLAIQTGFGCSSTLKAEEAAAYGFKYVMFYTLDDDVTTYGDYYDLDPVEDTNFYSISSFVVTKDASLSIMGEVAKNTDYKLFFSASNYVAQSPAQLTANTMSNFSSFGPSLEVNLKPQVSAPGGNILSTWPLSAQGYAVLSGTSMATPFMAGCYALLKSQLPDLDVNDLFALIMNSATPLSWFYDKSILSSAAHQGTGLVNVQAAFNYESIVTPEQLSLGQTATSVKKTITIKNRSTRSKTYLISHRPAGLVDLEFETNLVNQVYPTYATVSFSTKSILVKGGASATVDVTITPPVVSSDMIPAYSGYIVVTNNNDVFNIPYVGQPFDFATVNLIAPIVPYPHKYPDASGSYIYLLDAPNMYNAFQIVLTSPKTPNRDIENFSMSGYNYPGFIFGTTNNCDQIRLDILPANTSFVPDKYGFDPTVTHNDLVYPNISSTTVGGLDILGTAIDFGYGPWIRSDKILFNWIDPTLPKADYRLVLRILRSGGDFNNPKAWQTWLSAIVSVR